MNFIESYKKYCTKLTPAENLTVKDFQAIRQLEQFIEDGLLTTDDVIKAFKIANKSRFLRGEVKKFKADFRWVINPKNIDKINSGKYNDDAKGEILKHDYDFKALELEMHKKNIERVERLKQDKEFRKWEEDFYVKYPNMREGVL